MVQAEVAVSAASVVFSASAVQIFSAHKHAITAQSSGNVYQYDAAGNMSSRKENNVTYAQTWNAENMLAVVTNTTTNQVSKFTYDGDGARVKFVGYQGSGRSWVCCWEVRAS